MPPRGHKQSPFVGRRTSLVDDSGPLLYRRYNNISQIVEGYVRAEVPDEAAASTDNGAAAKPARRQAEMSRSGQHCKQPDADVGSSGKLHRSKKRSIEDDGDSGHTSGRASEPEEDAQPGSKASASGEQAASKSRRRESVAGAHAESPTVQDPDGEAARRRKRRAAETESGGELVKKKKKKQKKELVSSAGTSACVGDGEFTNAGHAEAAAAENEETKAAEVASQKKKSKKKAGKTKRTEAEAEARNGEGDEGREAGAPGEVARKVAMQREVAGIEVSQAGGNWQEAMTFRERLGIKQGDMASASTKVPFSFGFGQQVESQEARDGRGESTAEEEEVAGRTEQEEWWLRKPRGGGAGGGPPLPGGGALDGEGYVRHRVYVGGMPFHWEEEEVAEFWSYCGEIQDLQLMRFPDTQRFKGIAFITFAAEEGYKAALACDGEEAEGRFLVVSKCRAPLRRPHHRRSDRQTRPPSEAAEACPPQDTETGAEGKRERPVYDAPAGKVDGYNVAYVGNIPWELDAEAVKQLFDGYNVHRVRLHTDKDTGKSKGFAHVHFQDAESMERALVLDGTSLLGRKIKVAYGQPKAAEGNDRQQAAEGAAGQHHGGGSSRQGRVQRAGQGGRSKT